MTRGFLLSPYIPMHGLPKNRTRFFDFFPRKFLWLSCRAGVWRAATVQERLRGPRPYSRGSAKLYAMESGGGGIRTRERRKASLVFKTSAIGRSATPPSSELAAQTKKLPSLTQQKL
jgi:hypothetical protein